MIIYATGSSKLFLKNSPNICQSLISHDEWSFEISTAITPSQIGIFRGIFSTVLSGGNIPLRVKFEPMAQTPPPRDRDFLGFASPGHRYGPFFSRRAVTTYFSQKFFGLPKRCIKCQCLYSLFVRHGSTGGLHSTILPALWGCGVPAG